MAGKSYRALAVALHVLAVTGWITPAPTASAEPKVLYYPKRPESPRWDYARTLVELALRYSAGAYVLKPSDEEMTQARAARELELGHIQFIWAGTSADYEQRFQPIRIPVLRGLDGYRICIINPDRQAAFDDVASLDAFKAFTIGQDPGWSDVPILQAAGFKLVTAPYGNLFGMVERDRVDCFLRGAHEVVGDVTNHKLEHPALAVEAKLLLVYPFTSFFFVNRNDTALAEALEMGLKRAYEDGSFMEHFNNHPAIRAIFDEAGIEQRRRFDIPNPLLTEETKAIPDLYWHRR